MEFRILGPLEVLNDGEAVDTGPHKQRSLLALLLIHANRVVPTDRILDQIWGEEADGKENSLWVYVSRLRAVLEPDLADAGQSKALATRDHGYVLNVDVDSIDAVRFERAVTKGRSLLADRSEDASQVLHDALDLWSGSALQDFAYDDFAQTEIVRLEELRIGATEDAFDADLRIGRAGELIGDLEAFQDRHPLRERPVGQLMLALYRAGRSADALRAFERFRRTIGEQLGIDPSPELRRLEEQILLHDSRLQLRTPKATRTGVVGDAVNPFKGLRPFQEDDAADFFGRDRLTAEVLRRLSEDERLLVLVGPSGSGKSSAVRAGLIPALRKGVVEGSDQWRVAHMLPGSDPFIELEAALLRATMDGPESLAETLQGEGDSGLLRAALRILPDDTSRLILAIDQFEELFTLVADEAIRERFVNQLVAALDDPYGRVVVLLTLRSDFYSQPFDYPEFADRMASGVINVVPLTSDELEAAALGPTQGTGVAVEPALLVELLTDVIGQPGGLPLFQYTLTELFDRRVGNVLTVDTYRSIDGVRGALTRRADELYGSLSDGEQEAAKQLFLRLVAIADQDEWTRRRVHASEIVALDIDVVAMQHVIERFATHRLLSLDRDQATGAPTVEVAHEALLHEWDRLRAWIEDNRHDLLRHRELAAAAGVWDTAGRDEDYVYRGGRLDDAIAWAETSAITLTATEQEFLDAGQARLTAERESEEERRLREQRLQRGARLRTWGLASAITVLVAVVATVLFVVTRPEGPKVALVQGGISVIQDLIEQGWNRAESELDFEGQRVVALIDDEEDVRALADAGYGLIIDGMFDQGTVAYALANDYPEISFVVFDGFDDSFANVTSLRFVREGGAYLMGVAAALASETGKIGFIGGYQGTTTEARRASYGAGARSINPSIEVDSVYLGPYQDGQNGPYLDTDLAKETAADMYRSGIDVIHHSAGEAGLGIAVAAAELTDELGRDLWVIGSEVDEQRVVPPDQASRFLTSMWKRWDSAVYEAVRAYLAGELEPGVHELGLAPGSVDYAPDGGLTASQAATLDEVKADIVAGIVDPEAPETLAPRWTRDADLTGLLVFDGVACSSDIDPTQVAAGDVVRMDLVNNSAVDVALTFARADGDVLPVTTAWIPPGDRNAGAMRLTPGLYEVECLTGSEVFEGASFTAVFETSCEGPAVESSDPAAVVEAFAAATNARNVDAVCSLFAEDAELVGSFMGDSVIGNAAIAEGLTPLDDDRWFQEYLITDLEVVDGVVIWSFEFRGLDDRFEVAGHRTYVEDGKITRWEWGEFVDD
ncbi:MAG: hypothetical protein BMS9Abin07_2238 [Acidimicrobiia bacterium]|nr:MAG: hypothetical protein BMS9Abin07_2238 [Acidimicrobiia bacterium]